VYVAPFVAMVRLAVVTKANDENLATLDRRTLIRDRIDVFFRVACCVDIESPTFMQTGKSRLNVEKLYQWDMKNHY